MAVFKYLTDEAHVAGFVESGNILFRPLSFFRALEGDLVRGDAHDGALRHAPDDGLVARREDGAVIDWTGMVLKSTPKTNDIFTTCMSRELSEDLAADFKAPYCVEIKDPEVLVRRLRMRAHPTSKIDYSTVFHGNMDYRPLAVEPDVDWALPERLVFLKPESFVYQNEYRIVIGRQGAFDVHNVDLVIEDIGAVPLPVSVTSRSFFVELGNLFEHVELHRF